MDILQTLQGKEVEVIYQGIVYRGKLIGAGEDEIYLQALNESFTLPMESIAEIREAPR